MTESVYCHLSESLLPKSMLRTLYNKTLAWSGSKAAPRWLAFVSFIESSAFPIPPYVMLIPMCMEKPDKSWRYATIAMVASVLGGFLGYFIGAVLFDTVGKPLLDFYHATESFNRFQALYNEWGGWILIMASITPIPYKIFTIASGLTGLNILTFAGASIINRSFRFFLVAGLIRFYGEPMKVFIDRYFTLLSTLALILLVGAVILAKYFL